MMVMMEMVMMVKSNKGGWLGRLFAGRVAAIVVPLGPGNGTA